MSVKIIPRPSTERGHADRGWLKTFHTFSFASYMSASHSQFGSLRVINEDRVEPSTGFGTHPHSSYEIFSYIVNGELEHRDSMGNVEVLKRGDVQLTSAGTGIRHSEKTHGQKQVHFIQIWTSPMFGNRQPKYFTRHFSDEEKKDKWARIVAPIDSEGVIFEREASGPAPVQSTVTLYSTLLSPSVSLSHTLPTPTVAPKKPSKAYIHVIQKSGYNVDASSGATIKVSGMGASVELREGDGAYISGNPGEDLTVENVGDKVAEILFFDVE